jgi:hypothetical protein
MGSLLFRSSKRIEDIGTVKEEEQPAEMIAIAFKSRNVPKVNRCIWGYSSQEAGNI